MSTKKMHPPIVIHSTGHPAGKASLLAIAAGKTAKDRQNVENIVPPQQNGTAGNSDQQTNHINNSHCGGGVKKISNNKIAAAPTNQCKAQVGVNSSAVSTLNSTNRRKSHRTNSPNRKRQEQQNIFNSLKAWNLKIAPSASVVAHGKPEPVAVVEKQSVINDAKPKVVTLAGGNEISKASSSISSAISTSASGQSSVSSNTSSNSSVNSNSISNTNSSNNVKSRKQSVAVATSIQAPKEPESAVTVMAQSVKKKETMESNYNKNGLNADPKEESCAQETSSLPDTKTGTTVVASASKGEKKLLNASGGFSANHRHPAANISSSVLSSAATSIPSSSVGAPSSSLAPSLSHTSTTTSVTSSSSATVSTSSLSANGSKHNGSRTSNAGKVLLPNVNPLPGASLDPIVLLQGKLRNPMKLESFIGAPQTHHISHHHSAHSHHPGQGQQLHGQQQQITPTTPPHYSLDFLHYVGMRMSSANGTSQTGNSSSAAASTLFRGNAHFNYNNFNQQLHQQQMIHQQQQQHQQQHIQRHYPNYYNNDELVIQTSGVAEPVYTNFGISDHMINGTVNGGVNNGANEAGMVYCYSQNHQHHHHHNHPAHQQPYNGGGHQSYHQNNNYQQHNRNFSRGGQHNNHQQNGGKKSWNNWHSGKKSNMLQGKYGNKGPNFNHGYRKNYHYYNNHHANGSHHYDQQQDHLRNLVYVRGYDRNRDAPGSQESTSRSPTPSPQSASPAIDTNDIGNSLSVTVSQDEKSDSGIEEAGGSLKKSGAVPSSSSSSSSMVSIPSTDSSAISSSASQNLSLELHCGTGQGYESDSSHSSSYNSHTYRHRKYANSGQVYRSSSSTSSGVSSTATFPPLNSDYIMQSSASATITPTAASSQVNDFFLRSQSYHGSHQNLSVLSGSASPNPPDSPIGSSRSVIGTQSMPMFSELFSGNHHHQQPSQQNHQRSHQSIYGSNSSLEISVQPGTGNSSTSANSNLSNCSMASTGSSNNGHSSAPSSTVPPNEAYSMQSGHPKRRYSGRISPIPYPGTNKPNRASMGGVSSTSANASSQQQTQLVPQSQPPSPTVVKNQAWNQHRPVTVSTAPPANVSHPPPSLPPVSPTQLLLPVEGSNYHTPADRFLARSHLVELISPPEDLAPPGSKWAPLSTAIWDKFAATQQTQHKFVQKIQLWKYLFMCIRKAFPRFSLYLVGSTISGFASDNSDVDMCLVCRTNAIPFDMRGEALFQLGQLKNYFMNISTFFEEFSVIQAKVPILRFRDMANSIVVDLNYNNCVGIRNTHLLYCYSQMDWRLRPLTLVVKLWAQHHNINDAKNMTISSYSLVLMVIHFLQYGVSPPILPCLHAMYPDKFVVCPTLQRMSDISNLDLTETVDPYKNDNTQSLGELFVQFLEYYASFDYTHYAISVRTASIIPIESARVARSYKNDPHHWRQLCIEEPFDLTNTARSVFDADIFEQIKSVFSICWRRLKDTNDLNSVFECEPLFIPVASALSLTS